MKLSKLTLDEKTLSITILRTGISVKPRHNGTEKITQNNNTQSKTQNKTPSITTRSKTTLSMTALIIATLSMAIKTVKNIYTILVIAIKLSVIPLSVMAPILLPTSEFCDELTSYLCRPLNILTVAQNK
jgi:hypothetical protein